MFSLLAMPASILGNELALKFGRHRAITAVMFSSAVVALLIGAFADKSPWLLLPLLLAYAITVPADSGALTSGMSMAADPELSRRDDGDAFDCRLQPVRARRLGASASRSTLPADRSSATGWMAAFSVLAAGILLGPVALYWSRMVTAPP